MENDDFVNMDRNNRRFSFNYKQILIFLVMMVSLYFFIPSNKNQDCDYEDCMRNRRVEGVVYRKFIDKSDHSVPKVVVRHLGGNQLDTLNFLMEKSGVFDVLNESDTIFKSINSLEFYKVVNDSLSLVGVISTNCKEDSR